MELVPQPLNGNLLVTVDASRVDAAVAIRFKEMFREAVQDGPARVVLDLSQVGFVDSSGLGAIVAAMKLLGPDRKLDLAGLTPTVAKVFRLTRMDSVFTIHASPDDAVCVGEGIERAG